MTEHQKDVLAGVALALLCAAMLVGGYGVLRLALRRGVARRDVRTPHHTTFLFDLHGFVIYALAQQ